MSYKTYVLQEINTDKETPATKEDISDLKQSLVWPPEYTRDSDLVKASNLRQEKESILNNLSLSPGDKLKLLSELDQNFNLFQSKAENLFQPSNTHTNTDQFISSVNSFEHGKPLSIDEIATNLKLKGERKYKAGQILKKITKLKGVVWNSKGELYDPNSRQSIPNSDIHELIKYDLQPNKLNTLTPTGYYLFTQLKALSKLEDVSSGSEDDSEDYYSEVEEFRSPQLAQASEKSVTPVQTSKRNLTPKNTPTTSGEKPAKPSASKKKTTLSTSKSFSGRRNTPPTSKPLPGKSKFKGKGYNKPVSWKKIISELLS